MIPIARILGAPVIEPPGNIAIRTVVVEGGAASFHVGGGIVADSTPDGEYEETLVKAKGMMRALSTRWEG
jgi:anthranilate/para-aminobenzoate synthase component I